MGEEIKEVKAGDEKKGITLVRLPAPSEIGLTCEV